MSAHPPATAWGAHPEQLTSRPPAGSGGSSATPAGRAALGLLRVGDLVMARRHLPNLKTPAELDARRRAALRSADGTPSTDKLAEIGSPGRLRDRLLEAI